jgi:hypothetical protein
MLVTLPPLRIHLHTFKTIHNSRFLPGWASVFGPVIPKHTVLSWNCKCQISVSQSRDEVLTLWAWNIVLEETLVVGVRLLPVTLSHLQLCQSSC